MENKFMKKATFSEICKVMNGTEKDIKECISGVFEIALLFFPGLMCKNVALLTSIATGLTLIDAKSAIENSIKKITQVFNKDYKDFSTKYEHAQIAQVLIVFSSYFDSIKLYLPDEDRKISLSSKEKYTLTEESIKQYRDYLLEKSCEILDYDLSMPNPIESFEEYLKHLNDFYDILNREFVKFYEQLSFWDEMKEEKRDAFLSVIRKLPSESVENYKKQYYELATCFHDFFVWTNIQEHRFLSNKIDIGFKEISENIQLYIEKKSDLNAIITLEKYSKKYQYFIDKPIIDTTEMDYNSSEDITFPEKKEIFIPQSFKTILYKKDLRLEEKSVWTGCDERENIGKFISDTLRHPVIGELPLLILGHSGAGKSLLCNMLAAKILLREYHVIIIKLRDTVADETIMQQINQQIDRDFSNKCTWSNIVESGIEKPILLIFDGYDELLQASGRTHSDYLKKIVEFQNEQKVIHGVFVKCIITSRITLIDKALITDNTPVVRLLDFDDDRIKAWSEVWNNKNSIFFNNNKMESFEVDKKSKVYELAKQPLLLLMLALYDSNKNALKRQRDLNSTQLYNNLIREFISREKRKDEHYRGKIEKDQQDIIDAEVRRISIAALGMYNRKVLYIQSGELDSDIQYIESKENSHKEVINTELKESDKLLGSFFFIHKSNSTEISDRERIQNVAYEFLHNTFGEFLAANFIVDEIQILLNSINILVNNNMENQLNMLVYKSWYICLSYAPLFTRPVVIKMINEWSNTYLKDKGMNEEDIENAIEFLVNYEINKVITGESIFCLKTILEEKGNPFKQQDVLKHLSVYSMNLIMLRVIVSKKEYTFEFEKYKDNSIWDKLICLWKYSFSEDDLISYSNLFKAQRNDKSCYIQYFPEEKRFNSQQNRMEDLFCLNSALGNELSYSIVGALLGKNEKGDIISSVNKNELRINSRYCWNYILKYLHYGRIDSEEMLYMLEDFRMYCYKEGDQEYIFAYYLLINHLIKEKMIRVSRDFIVRNIIDGLEEMYYSYTFFERSGMQNAVIELILDLFEYAVLEEEDIERILQVYLRGNIHETHRYRDGIYNEIHLINRLLIIILSKSKNGRVIERLMDFREIDEYIERVIWEYSERLNSNKLLFEVFNLLSNFLQIKEYKISSRIFDRLIDLLHRVNFDRKNSLSISQKCIIIKCLYIMGNKRIIDDREILWIFSYLMRDTTIKKLFRYSEEAAFSLCSLLDMEMLFDNIRFEIDLNTLEQDLLWIVKTKGGSIEIYNFHLLMRLAEKFYFNELRYEIEKLIYQR